MTITQHYLGNVVLYGYGNLSMHSWKNPTFPSWFKKKSPYLYQRGTTANALRLACIFLQLMYLIYPCAMFLLQHAACNMTHEQHCSLCMLSLIVLQITHYGAYTG